MGNKTSKDSKNKKNSDFTNSDSLPEISELDINQETFNPTKLERSTETKWINAGIDYYEQRKNYLILKDEIDNDLDIFYEKRNCKRCGNCLKLTFCKPVKLWNFLKRKQCISFIIVLLILGITCLITSLVFSVLSDKELNVIKNEQNLCDSKVDVGSSGENSCIGDEIDAVINNRIKCILNQKNAGPISQSISDFQLYSKFDVSFQTVSIIVFGVICFISSNNQTRKRENTIDVNELERIYEYSEEKKERDNLEKEYEKVYTEAVKAATKLLKKESKEKEPTAYQITKLLNDKIKQGEEELDKVEYLLDPYSKGEHIENIGKTVEGK